MIGNCGLLSSMFCGEGKLHCQCELPILQSKTVLGMKFDTPCNYIVYLQPQCFFKLNYILLVYQQKHQMFWADINVFTKRGVCCGTIIIVELYRCEPFKLYYTVDLSYKPQSL